MADYYIKKVAYQNLTRFESYNYRPSTISKTVSNIFGSNRLLTMLEKYNSSEIKFRLIEKTPALLQPDYVFFSIIDCLNSVSSIYVIS